jgi:pimeloyl-ACP methyl ester carboxylesterase
MFFSEKKNQKTFAYQWFGGAVGLLLRAKCQKFFASFFQKRSSLLLFLLLAAAGHCPPGAECGIVIRRLDPSGRVGGTVPVAYALFRHTGPTWAGTIVAQEGGPGLPSIGSHGAYLALFAPFRVDHDMLMVDARGTGASGLVTCSLLQHQQVQTVAAVGACGRELGADAVLYGSGLAADDMAAVLDKLGIGRVDYYGDSYGTFFGQVFAARHPERLRSMVLDGAYPVIGESGFYPSGGAVVRFGFDAACKRSPYCAGLPGRSVGRIEALLDYVRGHRVAGRAPDGDGRMRHVVADAGSIGLVLYQGLSGPLNYRDLDASWRALRDYGDAAGLLRLVAENATLDGPSRAFGYSRGLNAAVSCMDYQQIYDMNAPLAERRRQRAASLAYERKTDPGVYAPLSIDGYLQVSIDIDLLDYCLEYPVRRPPYAPGMPVPAGDHFSGAPVLVMNGELDMLTTAEEGKLVAAEFPHASQVVIANSFHVDALGDIDDCAQPIVRHFVATLQVGDISCAAKVAPVRLVPFFAQHAADAVPVIPGDGNMADARARGVAAAAVQTAGDAAARWYVNYSGTDVGLHGGAWSYSQDGKVPTFTLKDLRWAADLAVSGTVVWDQRDGAISADLRFAGDDGTAGKLTAQWNDRASLRPALVSGVVGGQVLVGTMPAP